jgi:hypothetical protein
MRHRLGAIAAAGMLTIALPAVPAFAQKTKTKPSAVESTIPEREVTASIFPTSMPCAPMLMSPPCGKYSAAIWSITPMPWQA